MAIPRTVGRWNKVGLNRVTRRIAPWLPGFGVVVHRGRRSGRTYRTPVNVFPTGHGYRFALTYGADTDWVKNVLAAGGCQLETRGRVVRLSQGEATRQTVYGTDPAAVALDDLGTRFRRGERPRDVTSRAPVSRVAACRSWHVPRLRREPYAVLCG